MNQQYIGIEFLDCQYKLNIVESFSEHYNKYLIKREDQHYSDRSRGLMSDQDIEFYLNKQDKLKRLLKERQEREAAEQQQKELELKEYNNTYGYADNLTPLQRGKILKVLNTKENIFSEGKYIATLTRKDFIKQKLEQGSTLEHKTDIRYYDKRGNLKIKKNSYRLMGSDNSFYELNKTEYNYAIYLINNILN